LDSTRAVSPLVQADGAIELDTTDLEVDQVIKIIVDIATNR
jgi:cytidylate kinase